MASGGLHSMTNRDSRKGAVCMDILDENSNVNKICKPSENCNKGR